MKKHEIATHALLTPMHCTRVSASTYDKMWSTTSAGRSASKSADGRLGLGRELRERGDVVGSFDGVAAFFGDGEGASSSSTLSMQYRTSIRIGILQGVSEGVVFACDTLRERNVLQTELIITQTGIIS